MQPLTVLFTYYRDDAVTRIHWELLRHSNPGVPVVPLVDGAVPFLPGTVDVGSMPWRWGRDRSPWRNVDTFAYRFRLGVSDPRLEAERYAMVESDTLVTMPLADYFRGVWDADVAGSVIAYPETHPGWVWWDEDVGPLRDRRAGVMPSGVVLFSRRALGVLAASTLACFAELRIGTLARAAGLTLAEVEGGLKSVDCGEKRIQLGSGPGVYHPVKVFGGRDGLCRVAHLFGQALLQGHLSPLGSGTSPWGQWEDVSAISDVSRAFRIGMMQIETEINALYEFVKNIEPINVMEIGSNEGGTFYLWSRLGKGKKISLDLPGGPFGSVSIQRGREIEGEMKGWGPHVHCVRSDSRSPSSLIQVTQILDGELLDFLFIDGNRSYEGVKSDYETYSPLVKVGGWIAFHDIVDSAHHRAFGCMVSQFWSELTGDKIVIGATEHWGGIGLSRKS